MFGSGNEMGLRAASQQLIAAYIHSVQMHVHISMQMCKSTSQWYHLTKTSPLITCPATLRLDKLLNL